MFNDLILAPLFALFSSETAEIFIWTLFLSTQKLLEEIEQNKDKVDECQKYAKAYIDTIKASLK